MELFLGAIGLEMPSEAQGHDQMPMFFCSVEGIVTKDTDKEKQAQCGWREKI